MAKENKKSTAEKSAKLSGIYSTRNQVIAGVFLLLGVFLTWLLNRKNGETKETSVQNIENQKVDSGSIQNYNSKGNITVQNNTFNHISQKPDSIKTIENRREKISPPISNQKNDTQINITSNNQSGGQTANQIINNH